MRPGQTGQDGPRACEGSAFEGQYAPRADKRVPSTVPYIMTIRRSTTTPTEPTSTTLGPKLRQTQAEYTAARPNAEPGVRPMMSSSKMYVCIKCHANFKTGEGKPDPRLRGLGRCNSCLGATVQSA